MGCNTLKTEGGKGGGSHASSMVEATYTPSVITSSLPAGSRTGGRSRNSRRTIKRDRLYRIKK